jgi:hypothetical protein
MCISGGAAGGGIASTGPTAQHGREFRLHGMTPNASYAIEAKADCELARTVAAESSDGGPSQLELGTSLAGVMAEVDGVLRFRAHAHCGVEVTYLGPR